MFQYSRFDLARRALPAAALLAFLAACSSSQPTSGGSGSTTPASITISAGDGQTAQPGAAVAVNPAVVVKNSSGEPVAGVTVTFAIDSGGGSLAANSVVTGSNGVATAGTWTLGPTEGRNIVLATAGSLTPIRIAATAMLPGGSIPTATLPTSGGSIKVTDGALKGFELDVPSGAFSTALQVSITYASSAALPHAAAVTLASPVISLSSNVTAAASTPYTIRIPATIAAGKIPLVAMVDPTTGFLDALPVLSYDATGATALGTAVSETSALEGTLHRLVPLGAAVRSPASVAYALMLVDSALLHTVSIDTHFTPGVDDWEFQPQTTQVSPAGTEAGEVVSERYYFVNQRTFGAPALWANFEQEPGVEVSDASGIRWSSALTQEFFAAADPIIASAGAARIANAALYDRATIQTIAGSMIASEGRPQIVAFAIPPTNAYTVVLATKWDGPSGTLTTANPDFPGDGSRQAVWEANGLECTTSCLAVAGLNHLIGYSQLDGEFPSVVDGTIDKGAFPLAFATSYDPFINTGQPPDTLFMAHDTTRVWVECPGCSARFPTTLPLQHAAAGIETQQIYVPNGPGWSTVGGQSQDGFFLDIAQFPAPTSNHFADFQFGMEALGLLTPTNGSTATTGWLGWKTYRVIKFAPKLTATAPITGIPMTVTLTSDGGLALPVGYTYVFKWGDGSANTSVNPLPSTATHVYAAPGADTITMEMQHTGDNQVVGSATLPVTVVNGPNWQFDAVSRTGTNLPTLVNQQDSTEQSSADDFLSGAVGNPGSILLITSVRPGCSTATIEHFPASIAPVDTGLVQGTGTLVAASSCSGTFSLGPVGTGVLAGSGPPGTPVSGLGNLIFGGSGAINATMSGTSISGTLTWTLPYSSGSATYTLQFHAVLVSPKSLSVSVRKR